MFILSLVKLDPPTPHAETRATLKPNKLIKRAIINNNNIMSLSRSPSPPVLQLVQRSTQLLGRVPAAPVTATANIVHHIAAATSSTASTPVVVVVLQHINGRNN